MTEQLKLAENTFAKEKGRLFGFIRKFVSTQEDAEDILQDVFYQFISVSGVELIDKVTGWLYKTARNKIIDFSRKKKADNFSKTFSGYSDDEEDFSIEDFLPAIEFTPEDFYLQDEFNEKLEAALNELPEAQKDIFIMNEIEGISFKEISEITGLKINTLLSRKHYAVKQLKEKLNKYLNG